MVGSKTLANSGSVTCVDKCLCWQLIYGISKKSNSFSPVYSMLYSWLCEARGLQVILQYIQSPGEGDCTYVNKQNL